MDGDSVKVFDAPGLRALCLAARAAPSDAALQALASVSNQIAADGVMEYAVKPGLQVRGCQIQFDGATGTVLIRGMVRDKATQLDVFQRCARVQGVVGVIDQTEIDPSGQGSRPMSVSG